jgi:mRNA interferase RelE/StbE
MNELVLHRRAARYFERLPANDKESLRKKLKKLQQDPERFPGASKLSGIWSDYCRFRHGNLRVIYAYHPKERRIYINYIGPRGDVYKE